MTAARPRATPPPESQLAGPPLALVLGGAALLSQLSREHSLALDRRFAQFGITTQQAALLIHAAGQPTSPSRLTELLGTDTAGMTRLLDRLEAKRLLRRQRHTDDRRAIVIELTEQGRAIMPLLAPVFGHVNTQLFTGIADDEIELLTAMWQRMLANLRRDPP